MHRSRNRNKDRNEVTNGSAAGTFFNAGPTHQAASRVQKARAKEAAVDHHLAAAAAEALERTPLENEGVGGRLFPPVPPKVLGLKQAKAENSALACHSSPLLGPAADWNNGKASEQIQLSWQP